MTATSHQIDTKSGSSDGPVFVDFDTVMLATHQGERGVELGLQADLPDALGRLAEVASQIVILVYPAPSDGGRELQTARRLEVLSHGLGPTLDRLTVLTCPHGETGECDCAKPGVGLFELAFDEHDVERGRGWYITGDQEGVVAGRAAALGTIRIGPAGEDHLSAVHRADHEARDLLDAANRIMVEEVADP